jgi:hypothetical protein
MYFIIDFKKVIFTYINLILRETFKKFLTNLKFILYYIKIICLLLFIVHIYKFVL